jgi:signal recognition particle subunit SRP54
MGPLENLINMIPGMNKIKNLDIDGRELVKVEAIISSMTKKEKRDHNIINGNRRRRIALGSGTTVPDVNRVIKQYIEIKKMLKMFKGKKGFKLPKVLPF